MITQVIDAFRPRIEVEGRTFVCRTVHLPTALHRNDAAGPWLPATEAQLLAFEKRHMRGEGPPSSPIVALGSGAKHEDRFTSVPFIGIDNRAPGVFPGGLRSHGKTTVFLRGGLNDECVALEVKSKD